MPCGTGKSLTAYWIAEALESETHSDVPVGMKMKLGDFAEVISMRLWESVGPRTEII